MSCAFEFFDWTLSRKLVDPLDRQESILAGPTPESIRSSTYIAIVYVLRQVVDLKDRNKNK